MRVPSLSSTTHVVSLSSPNFSEPENRSKNIKTYGPAEVKPRYKIGIKLVAQR
jgi:hypothetical protein